MSERRDVVVLSAVRTAIGDYGGSLKDFAPKELGAMVVVAAVSRLIPGVLGGERSSLEDSFEEGLLDSVTVCSELIQP